MAWLLLLSIAGCNLPNRTDATFTVAPVFTPTQTIKETPTIAPSLSPSATKSPTSTVEVILPTGTEESPIVTPTVFVCLRLISPPDGELLVDGGKVVFSWEAMPGAVEYELLFVLPNGRFETYRLSQTSYERSLYSFPLGGSYNWQVSAFDAAGKRLCLAGMYHFSRPIATPTSRSTEDTNDDTEPDEPMGLFGFGCPSCTWADCIVFPLAQINWLLPGKCPVDQVLDAKYAILPPLEVV